MLQNQVDKDSGTNQESSPKQVEVSRFHDRRDDHGGYRQLRSIRRHQHHHSLGNLNKKTYAHSRLEIIPSISPIRHKRRRHGSDNLQGELREIKPPSFDGENKKGS